MAFPKRPFFYEQFDTTRNESYLTTNTTYLHSIYALNPIILVIRVQQLMKVLLSKYKMCNEPEGNNCIVSEEKDVLAYVGVNYTGPIRKIA